MWQVDTGTGGVIKQNGLSIGRTVTYLYISPYYPEELYITGKEVTISVPESTYRFIFIYELENFNPACEIILRTKLINSIVWI